MPLADVRAGGLDNLFYTYNFYCYKLHEMITLGSKL